MEKGRGKGTDTLKKDNDFVRRGDVKCLLKNTVCLHEELPAQIDIIPAANVVPVVRCGDCSIRFEFSWCGLFPYDGYCFAGVRKDGDGE